MRAKASDSDEPEPRIHNGYTMDECKRAMAANNDFSRWNELQANNKRYFDAQDQLRRDEAEFEKSYQERLVEQQAFLEAQGKVRPGAQAGRHESSCTSGQPADRHNMMTQLMEEHFGASKEKMKRERTKTGWPRLWKSTSS